MKNHFPYSTFCYPQSSSKYDSFLLDDDAIPLSSLNHNHTWDLVPKPPNANVVGCHWLYHHKFVSHVKLDRYKSHLVAQGFSQQPGHDFDDTFSMVIKPATIHIVLSIVISCNWLIHQLDVYMKQPAGYMYPHHPDYTCRLRQALYGLK
uniref:Reverse transcriptase Ty1/copia-type domain-containing protein n=1 Tax=Lactuca sativa TaxID=4236 RepID=A0A9R1WXW5_LACSA|nr:hypothetical protein LSAT_V11C800392430 [Lactuca sativa]